jgi:hypothetical protein
MELRGDLGHVESHFSSFGDGISVSARQVHGLRQTYYRLSIVLDVPDGTCRRNVVGSLPRGMPRVVICR